MPDHLPNRLKHLRFTSKTKPLPYTGDGRGTFDIYPRDNRAGHVAYLQRQLAPIQQEFSQVEQDRQQQGLTSDFGLILNVTSEPGFPLEYGSLEKATTKNALGITLLNVRREQTPLGEVTKAAIFVPHGQLKALEQKVKDYATKDSKDRKGNVTGPRNARLLNNICAISSAALDALWTDPETIPAPQESVWFELWIRRDDRSDCHRVLLAETARLGIELKDQTLSLPDHLVVIGKGTRARLESSLDLLNCLSEVRRARPCSVGLTDLTGLEQEEWIDEALSRIQWPGEDAPAVCLLDTGVNRGHPLIEPLLSISDMSTVFGDGDTADETHPRWKHGTPMAGLAAFGDLRALMLSSETWEQLHRLESVKLIRSSTQHDPENYGAVTLSAINEPESIAPHRVRIFCMAVTASGPKTFGNPSSWSTAVDIAAAGAQDETDRPRVILVSAGNTEDHDESFSYPTTLRSNPIEDPAQAWNAVTVGAITAHTAIGETDHEALRCDPLAPNHHLSPYTRTSHSWCEGRKDWPIAPDIVMEGGNLGKHRDIEHEYPALPSLAPLSTASSFALKPIQMFNATSAATALAARVAARITQRYPEASPETIRGLLVHAARWPQELLNDLGLDPHRTGSSMAVQDLMRGYGFGVVNEQRALDSLSNQVTFYTERILQPYKGTAGSANFNEFHLIVLPWPVDLLQEHHDTTCTLRVTLSYFIHPNPGTRSWDNGKKYKYASHLLGFTPKHKGHTLAEFRSRMHADEDALAGSLQDPGWALGDKLRRKGGSLIQDVWKGPAADLATMEAIAVFPRARGWWATRKYGEDRQEHNCHLNSVSYSLIISLETEANLPIYNEIEAAIQLIETGIDIPS